MAAPGTDLSDNGCILAEKSVEYYGYPEILHTRRFVHQSVESGNIPIERRGRR